MAATLRDESETRVNLLGFTILVHESGEGETGYWGEVVEMPGCVSQGETLAELRANMHEAMEAIRDNSRTSIPNAPSQITIWPSAGTGTA